MADMRITSGVALTGLPVNLLPLIDDTDFKTIEAAVAYNAAGLSLRFHFVTTDGQYTVASVTPTTGGLYDWTDPGDSGIYTIEMPISGGTTNAMNTRTGYGWFTGVATGIMPWRSPVYEFVHPNITASLVDGLEFLEVSALKQYAEIVGNDMVAKKRDNTTTQFTVPVEVTPGADVLTKIG